jgi:hypothetical protein
MDDTDAAAATTFFFATYGKLFVLTFNCSIRNTSKYRTSHILVYLCLQASFLSVERDFIDGVLNMGGSDGARAVAPATTRRRDRVICLTVVLV